MKKINFGVLVILCALVTGCASSASRSVSLTNKISTQTNLASNSINEALDSKDQIHKLIKQNELYDNKETKLIDIYNQP